MIKIKMFNFCLILLFLVIFSLPSHINANQNDDFKKWVINFKSVAIKKGISNETFDETMKDARFLPKVIEYDRYQPEFMSTFTYVKKRSNSLKVKRYYFIKMKKILLMRLKKILS